MKVLNARKGLLLTQRVLLWRTTVWSCMLYGLGACGLTASHLASLQTLALKQLRALSCSPAHIHHESDAALCLRLGVPLPKDALRHLFDKTLLRQDPDDPFVLGPLHPWALYLQSCWACGTPDYSAPASSSPFDSGVPPGLPLPLGPPLALPTRCRSCFPVKIHWMPRNLRCPFTMLSLRKLFPVRCPLHPPLVRPFLVHFVHARLTRASP